MQFRFTNTPVIFQRRINYILKEYLDDFVIVYIDNIIIYSTSKKEYKKHVKWVLGRLYEENIPVVIKKYEFYTKKTDFIGFIIKLKQISIDLKSVIGLRLFLGFCNYYKRFIINQLSKIKLFIRMTRKDKNQKQKKK